MSEDVDINLVPSTGFSKNSLKQRKTIRKHIVSEIYESIEHSDLFEFDDEFPKKTFNEYRHSCLSIRYPQEFLQAPFLRPFIKLELVETEMLQEPQTHSITGLISAKAKKPNRPKQYKKRAQG